MQFLRDIDPGRIIKMKASSSPDFLTEEKINRYLSQIEYQSFPYSDDEQYTQAAVLIPLIRLNEDWHLMYTRRTEKVNSHKGQVSFPGGSREKGDKRAEDTALRETNEEIGLERENTRLLGRLNTIKSISKFVIIPVVARILHPFTYRLSQDEVDRVFTIPLTWLTQKGNYQIQGTRINGNVYEDIVFFNKYDGELLWGLTARITLDFLRLLELI